MKKSHTIRNLLLFIIIFGIGGGLLYYYFFVKEDNDNGDVISNIFESKKVEDVKNGIYVYKEDTDKTVTVFSNCVVSSIDDYIVVVNDKYYMYNGSCMVMNYKGTGNSNELEFIKDKDNKFKIKNNNREYSKEINPVTLINNNNIINELKKTSLDIINFVIKYTEVEGSYYNFSTVINNSVNYYNYRFSYVDNHFNLNISDLYNKSFNSINDFPNIYFYNGNLVLVDKEFINDKYSSNILMYDLKSNVYNFNSILPIMINGETLDSSYNTLIRFDSVNKNFYAVFSRDNTFCNSSLDVMYYEFKLSYDYKRNGFTNVELSKKGKKEEDCSYIKKYYFKEN